MTQKAIAICGLILAALVAFGGAAATVWTLGQSAGEIKSDVAALKTDVREIKKALGIESRETAQVAP